MATSPLLVASQALATAGLRPMEGAATTQAAGNALNLVAWGAEERSFVPALLPLPGLLRWVLAERIQAK